MILTAKDIAEITRLLDDSHFSQLRLEIGDFKLRVSRGGSGRRFVEEEDDEPEPAPASKASPGPASAPTTQADGIDVTAPLLGNFYRSPRPGDAPFVEVGDTVTEDSAIGIIEVMKLMNSVRAGVAGTVVAILAEDGKAVEAGQPLIRVKAA
jgi:acetyl-CoA carboxylase biotin carboxyl carrier protein